MPFHCRQCGLPLKVDKTYCYGCYELFCVLFSSKYWEFIHEQWKKQTEDRKDDK